MDEIMIKDMDLYYKCIKLTLEKFNFENLRNKSVAITGANGLIGSAIIDVLNYLNASLNYNITIIAIVRSNIRERFMKYSNLKVVKQDITNKIMLNDEVDYIIHAASNAHPIAYSMDPVGTMFGNFIGMKNVLEFAYTHNVKRIEYISSGEVYGQGEKDIISFNENYSGNINSTNPRSCYPISKLAAETLCVSYSKQYNLETVITRPCHIYGPTQTESDSRVSAQFIRNILNNEDIVMKSKGEQVRSYCFVLDCVTAILTVLLKGENSNAYNIANKDSVISIKDMAKVIASKKNKKVILELPTEVEKNGYTTITRAVLDTTKLEKLGWNAIWSFDKGIEETLKIMK